MRIRSLLLTALAVLLPAIALAAVLATVPIGRTDLKWWRDRHEEKLAEIHRGPVQLVWLGDSITQDWEKPAFQPIWQRFYGDRHAINLGFIGDTTSSVLWRIEHGELSGISPKVIVLLIGANNMGRPHWDASETVQGIEAIIAQIHERLPQTKVLLSACCRATGPPGSRKRRRRSTACWRHVMVRIRAGKSRISTSRMSSCATASWMRASSWIRR